MSLQYSAVGGVTCMRLEQREERAQNQSTGIDCEQKDLESGGQDWPSIA